ncbi:MAG: hypothetical protein ACTHU0_16355 [Kofleriaceae bacterium]
MRSWLVSGVVVVSSAAFADPKAVEAVVKTNVTKLAALEDDDQLALAANAIVITHMGNIVDLSNETGCTLGAVSNSFYGCLQARITHKLGAIAVGVDAAKGVAWFQAPYTILFEGEDPETSKPTRSTESMRTGGIVIRTGKTWEIAAQLYSKLVSDKELLAGTDGKPAAGAPKLTGDKKLAGLVAGWFATGFALQAAKTGTLIASGTGPSEFKTGAAATKLAASFDKLGLGATEVDAKLLANGTIGWVTATVKLPRKTGKGAVEMKLAVVAVPDGDSWRWVSLQYQFPWNPVGR